MQAMSLVVTDGDGEQNEMRILQDKLAATMKVVTTLTSQLNELKEQVLALFVFSFLQVILKYLGYQWKIHLHTTGAPYQQYSSP